MSILCKALGYKSLGRREIIWEGLLHLLLPLLFSVLLVVWLCLLWLLLLHNSDNDGIDSDVYLLLNVLILVDVTL
jgi:hypothetical protein